LAGVKVQGKWGFVDTSGQMVVAPQFDECGGFTNGLVEVKVGKKFGYIDKTGKYIWTPTD
jgi:WG containing repeat